NSFCGDGTAFGVHPEALVRGVDFTTGSLGHGLAMGAGAALAARLERSTRRIFVLISDAELNEGSIWESVMFAAHHQLSNLVVIVDLDGQQALGYTKDVLDLCELAPRWKAFGWNVSEIDGHDPEAISQTIASLDTKSGRPHVIIANTVFGKGVSFMQSQIEWHYMPMSDDQYQQAVDEVSAMS
ncbi:MAG: thiamine pyrophosphate-dependent enzyme, partial [Actinomycetota bacterium]